MMRSHVRPVVEGQGLHSGLDSNKWEGPGALQSNTLTAAQVDEARKVATAFRHMLPILGVPEDSHDEAVQVIADLEEEASAPEPKQSRIKNLLFKSLELIALGTAGGSADALGAMTQSAIDGLG